MNFSRILVLGVLLYIHLLQVECQIYSIDDFFQEYREKTPKSINFCETREDRCSSSNSEQTIDGSCNNVQHTSWGATNTPLVRILPAVYHDSKGQVKYSRSGRPLPSTRVVSNALSKEVKKVSSSVSHMHVLWGQFLAHDIVHAPIVKNEDNTKLDCNCASPHKECINIPVPKNDEQFVKAGVKCFPLARSKPAVGIKGCNFAQREPINALSSFIDGTMVYGKTDKEALELRDPYSDAGLLRTLVDPNGNSGGLLPLQEQLKNTGISKTTDCDKDVHKPTNIGCFVAGDVRNNENTGLVSIHTIWLRYHNKMAKRLKKVNKNWSSDKIFEQTRRIIIALIQMVTYREYIPLLLGPLWSKRFDLELKTSGYWNGYDQEHFPGITNEFTTAAFRYGHSQVKASLRRPGTYFSDVRIPDVQTKNSFFNSEPLLNVGEGGVGSLMRGFMLDDAEKTDATVVDDMRNQLFTKFGKKFGGDLLAINTQRGRDHGLPGYNYYRELCGLSKASSFHDLSGEMNKETIKAMKSVYESVDDIDLYIGGLSEKHSKDAEVGPTFACILAYQFRAIRRGDRYWHESSDSPTSFSSDQLETLRDVTFARILCDVADDMKYVLKHPLESTRKSSGQVFHCNRIPDIDLSKWKDSHYDHYTSPMHEDGGGEWSTWFVTSVTKEWLLDEEKVSKEIRKRREDEICQRFLSSETRKVSGDSHLQIRFRCPSGSIKRSDFPRELNQKHHLSKWVKARTIDFNRGYEVSSSEFGCSKVVALQAQVLNQDKFARETGDVFEDYDIENGFKCLHKHQIEGHCQQYRVRALCEGVDKHREQTFETSTYKSYSDGNNPVYTTMYTAPTYTESTTPTAYTAPVVPYFIRYRARQFCSTYGVCCKSQNNFYSIISVPSSVRKSQSRYCTKYNICC